MQYFQLRVSPYEDSFCKYPLGIFSFLSLYFTFVQDTIYDCAEVFLSLININAPAKKNI